MRSGAQAYAPKTEKSAYAPKTKRKKALWRPKLNEKAPMRLKLNEKKRLGTQN